METYIYLNGQFVDRVSNTPRRVVRSLKAQGFAVVRWHVRRVRDRICGDSNELRITTA